MIQAPEFLKRYTRVPNTFVDQLYAMYNENHTPYDLVIDLDIVARWLKVRKSKLLTTLRYSYKNGFDYVVEKAPNPRQGIDPKYKKANNYKRVMITPECFKKLTMQSKSKNADEIRNYFIEIEYLLLQYRDDVVKGIKARAAQLERNQQSKSAQKQTKQGFIYVLKASETHDSLFKIGRTKNLEQRLRTYQTGRADDVEVLYTYECDDIEAIEGCVKNFLKQRRYRKYKEVYMADLDMIKELITGCQKLKQRFSSRKAPIMTGGYYLAIFKNSDQNSVLY